MDTQDTSQKKEEPVSNGRVSFLDQILTQWETGQWEDIPNQTPVASGGITSQEPPKKKRTSLTPIQILKIVWALFLVALIVFWSFLAYIVFNPAQAKFFLAFGINLADVASLLQHLVNGIFWAITFVLCVVWAIFLFRAIITKQELKRKKTVATILALFVGIVLFSNIAFWAYLFQKIWASDFVRPNGGVSLYDNDLYISSWYREYSEINDPTNYIGPITVRYDIASDAKHASKTMTIDSYVIEDFWDGTLVNPKEWIDPSNATDIIHTYQRKGKFTPKGYFLGIDRLTNESIKKPIEFEPINIVGIVGITNSENTMTFDAKDITTLGNPEWFLENDLQKPASTEKKFTTSIEKSDKIVCLVMKWAKKKSSLWCDRIFFVQPKTDAPIIATITWKPDTINPLKYTIGLEGLMIKSGWELMKIKWFMGDNTLVSTEESFTYTFSHYGENTITAELTDSASNSVTIRTKMFVTEPLTLLKNSNQESLLKITTEWSNANLIIGNYDRNIESYRLQDIAIPGEYTFNATDIRVKNEGFELQEARWNLDSQEKKWLKTSFQLLDERRYEITVTYSFKKRWTEQILTASEKIVIEGKKSEIVPKMSIVPENGNIDGMYAPIRITFDASASSVREGKIAKFIYDFGEGKPASEWDAVQLYQYNVAGNYTITLTVMKDDGTKAQISRAITIKDIPKQMIISPSVSIAKAWLGVDFTSSTTGQIAQYEWNFWDNSMLSSEPNPTHVFAQAWIYTVKLTATYTDGTLKTAELDMKVE